MTGTIIRGRGAISHVRRCSLLALLGSASIVTACDREMPTGIENHREREQRVVEIPSSPLSAYDDGINRNDTYVEQTQMVAETTTVSASEPFDDPTTGQQVYSTTIGTAPQSVNVSAGYGYDGQPRVTTGFQQMVGEETVWLRRITDATTDRRGDGFDTPAIAYDPMAEVGSLVGAQLDPTGTGGGSGGSGGGSCTQITGCYALRAAGSSSDNVIRPLGDRGPAITLMHGGRGVQVKVLSRDRIRVEEYHPEEARVATGLTTHPGIGPAAASSQADSAKTEHKVTREFTRENGEWMVKRTIHETFVETPDAKAHHALHLTVVRSTFHRNAQKDAERASAARQQGAVTGLPLGVVAGTRLSSETCDVWTAIVPCETQVTSGASIDPPLDHTSAVAGDYSLGVSTSGPSLVLAHGFVSDARTWHLMEKWLARDIPVRDIYRFTTPWWDSYENQAALLHQSISNTIGTNRVYLIGHSNGGMVARYLARHPDVGGYWWLPPVNVGGVVTIGTPHLGAPLAKHAKSINRLFGWGDRAATLICNWSNTAGCASFSTIAKSSYTRLFAALTSNPAIVNEMQPDDAYHAGFNSEPESFERYSVSSHVWTRWMIWRGYGDAYCYPDSSCGGRAQVRKIDRIYKRDIACTVIASLFGRYDFAVRCAADAVFLRASDEIYRRYVDFVGDVVVPARSQMYPNVSMDFRYFVDNGPSHWNETESSRVGNRVENILAYRMHLGGYAGLPQ